MSRSRVRTALAPILGLASAGSLLLLGWILFEPSGEARRPRLAAVVDGGSMEGHLRSPSERNTILHWVDAGAPREGWGEVRAVLGDRCVSCHYSDEAAFDVLPLDRYDPAAGAAEVLSRLQEKITGGTMGEYLDTAAEQATLVSWIERGAPELEWPLVQPILEAHCVHCHNPDGVAGLVYLDRYAPVARLAAPPSREPPPRLVAAAAAVAALVFAAFGVLAFRLRPGRRASSRTA